MRPHATSPLDTADALAERVAASIGPERSDALAAILVRCAIDPASYEASVRCRPGGMPSAGRMMIERAPTAVLTGIAGALDIALPQSATDWLRLAEQEGVPIIAGWDLRGGGAQRCLKLYVNASDASRATRGRLYTQLAPGATSSEPPAVIGLNARADGAVELKFYLQSADAVAVAADVSANARALAAAARAEGADAGGLLSLDVEDRALRARAFFIALREPPDGTDWRCVRTLPGYDPLALAALMPFSPAPARSIGLSLSDGAWTIYCKPRHSGRAPEALEPAAIFRAGDAEIGVYVEPTERAVRAFRRTERHAVSIRTREGSATPHALESLVDWFADRLRSAERDGAAIATRLGDPPTPWRLVGPIAAPRSPGDPS